MKNKIGLMLSIFILIFCFVGCEHSTRENNMDPEYPPKLTGTSSYGVVSLTWSATKDATSYEIFYSTSSSSSDALSLGSTSLTNFEKDLPY